MNQDIFDKLIKEKLEELEFEANDMQWAKLQKDIIAAQQKRNEDESDHIRGASYRVWLKRIAAVLIPLIAVSSILLLRNSGSKSTLVQHKQNQAETQQSNQSVNNSSNANTAVAQANAENTASTETQQASDNNSSQILVPNTAQVTNNNSSILQSRSSDNNYVQNNEQQQLGVRTAKPTPQADVKNNNIDATTIEQIPNNTSVATNAVKQIAESTQSNAQSTTLPNTNSVKNSNHASSIATNIISNKPQAPNVNMPLASPSSTRTRQHQQTKNYLASVSTSGGYNNRRAAVVNIGVGVERSINSAFAIETNLSMSSNGENGYIQNNNTSLLSTSSKTQDFQNIYATNIPRELAAGVFTQATDLSSRVGSFSSHQDVVVAISNITPNYDVALTPMLIYKAHPRVRFGVGADVSKIILGSSSEELDYLQRNASKPVEVRTWDAGYNAKAEYRVTRRISLAARYRGGLTRLVPDATSSPRSFASVGVKVGLR